MIFLISIVTFVSTVLGGFFALKLADRLHTILGFSAGAIMAVTFFDLLPEAQNLAGAAFSSQDIFSVTAVGFLLYLCLDRFFVGHHHDGEEGGESIRRGSLGAGSLSAHSFIDGLGIGFAFQVSVAVGAIVAVAVLTHDFCDGINTVNMVVKNKGSSSRAMKWLFIDAVAPVLGVISASFFSISPAALGMLLALFGGFFIYIGASDLIPESYHAHPVRLTTLTTLAGAGLVYLAIRLAGF